MLLFLRDRKIYLTIRDSAAMLHILQSMVFSLLSDSNHGCFGREK